METMITAPTRTTAPKTKRARINYTDCHRRTMLKRPGVTLLLTQKDRKGRGQVVSDMWKIEGTAGPCFIYTRTSLIDLGEFGLRMVTFGHNYYGTEAEARAFWEGLDRAAYEGIPADLREALAIG